MKKKTKQVGDKEPAEWLLIEGVARLDQKKVLTFCQVLGWLVGHEWWLWFALVS